MNISKDRPMEELIGDNRSVVRMKLGDIHCMTPFREALRVCRPRNIHKMPSGLRRGLILCVKETLEEYRSTYLGVMSGRMGEVKHEIRDIFSL